VGLFQRSLFLRTTTLLTWLKSTLLLKNKCFDTTIYMKTQCLQTNETQHYGKGKCLRSEGWSRERVALIKSLIYARWKRDALEAWLPNRAENVSWYLQLFKNSPCCTTSTWNATFGWTFRCCVTYSKSKKRIAYCYEITSLIVIKLRVPMISKLDQYFILIDIL